MKIDLPYMRLERANELLRELTPSFIAKENFDKTELSKAVGVKKSTAMNLVTTLKAVKLIIGRGQYKFTEEGRTYATRLLRKDDDKTREIIKKIAENLDYFHDIKTSLTQKGKLNVEDIGNQLAIRYNQKWSNPHTLRTCGAAVSSILDFAGIAYYRSGTLFLEDTGKTPESIPSPQVGINKIIKILEALFPNGRDMHQMAIKLKTKEGRLGGELSCCMELGFVKREYRGFYKLTDVGGKMISPHTKETDKKTIFRERLLASRYGLMITKASGKEITLEDIGELLRFEFGMFGAEWSAKSTVRTYSKKFASWLTYAGILERRGKNSYKVNDVKRETSIEELKRMRLRNAGEPRVFVPKDFLQYYLLGKNVGQLLQPGGGEETVKEAVPRIIAFCRNNQSSDELFEGWSEDYKLYLDLRDPRIFIRDIKALEKALGLRL